MRAILFLSSLLVLSFVIVGGPTAFADLAKASLSSTARTEPLPPAEMAESRLTLAVPTPVLDYAADPDDYEQFTFLHDGKERTWLAWGGDNVSDLEALVGSRFPVIVLLHGSDQSGASMIDKWDAVAKGYILVAPISASSDGWSNVVDGEAFMSELLDNVAGRVRIDRDRVFLFGVSNGASHAQFLANSTRGQWRGVATHGAALPPEAVQPAGSAVPMKLYLGGGDEHSETGDVRASARALAAAGHPIDFIVIPGNSHWYYGVAHDLNSHVMEWFRELK